MAFPSVTQCFQVIYKIRSDKTANAKLRKAQNTRKTSEKASEKVIAYFD